MSFLRGSVRQVRAERTLERREEKPGADFEAQEREDDVWARAVTVAVKIILLHKRRPIAKSPGPNPEMGTLLSPLRANAWRGLA